MVSWQAVYYLIDWFLIYFLYWLPSGSFITISYYLFTHKVDSNSVYNWSCLSSMNSVTVLHNCLDFHLNAVIAKVPGYFEKSLLVHFDSCELKLKTCSSDSNLGRCLKHFCLALLLSQLLLTCAESAPDHHHLICYLISYFHNQSGFWRGEVPYQRMSQDVAKLIQYDSGSFDSKHSMAIFHCFCFTYLTVHQIQIYHYHC